MSHHNNKYTHHIGSWESKLIIMSASLGGSSLMMYTTLVLDFRINLFKIILFVLFIITIFYSFLINIIKYDDKYIYISNFFTEKKYLLDEIYYIRDYKNIYTSYIKIKNKRVFFSRISFFRDINSIINDKSFLKLKKIIENNRR